MPTLVALTDLDPAILDHLLDSLAVVFPVLRRRGWPGVWFVEVEESEEDIGTDACARVGQTLDDLNIDWSGRVNIMMASELDEHG
jgi:hypothetical protein